MLKGHVKIERGAAQHRLTPALNPHTKAAREVTGRSAVNLIQKHLRDRDRTHPNKLGGRRTHFYAAAARGTSFQLVADGALIAINKEGIRQRLLGGTIRPIRAKALAIPARPEAHGRSPREFDDLFLVKRASFAALARKSGRTIRIMYWLRKSVTQRPDPDVLPSRQTIAEHVAKDLAAHLARQAAMEQTNG